MAKLKCDIFPKLYKMLTKFQAWVAQEVDDECYPPDKSQSIQRITWFALLSLIYWTVIYPVDSIVHPLNK